jgi:hypothetical protein
LIGEEINWVHAGGMAFYWKEATEGIDVHVPLMLSGRFKNEVGGKYFCQSLAPVTDSGRNLRIWFERKLSVLTQQSMCKGPMFKSRTMGKKMSISKMDELFHSLLLEVQRRYPKVLSDSVKITDKFMSASAASTSIWSVSFLLGVVSVSFTFAASSSKLTVIPASASRSLSSIYSSLSVGVFSSPYGLTTLALVSTLAFLSTCALDSELVEMDSLSCLFAPSTAFLAPRGSPSTTTFLTLLFADLPRAVPRLAYLFLCVDDVV